MWFACFRFVCLLFFSSSSFFLPACLISTFGFNAYDLKLFNE